MSRPVALIQGASRGIGLQFCRHIIKNRPDVSILATCRNPESAAQLQTLHSQHNDRLQIYKLDVTNTDDIKNVATYVKSEHGSLDLLINSSGMLHPSGKGETSLNSVSLEGLQETMTTNAFGALMMMKHLAPYMKKGSGSFGAQQSADKDRHASIVVNMSAKVGSITDNGLGGWYSYRMSKCALNMATRNIGIEFGRGRNKVLSVALHPGTVDTDLSRPYHANVPQGKLFTTEYSVNCLMDIINKLDFRSTGKYFSWDGTELPF